VHLTHKQPHLACWPCAEQLRVGCWRVHLTHWQPHLTCWPCAEELQTGADGALERATRHPNHL
jgi:hypothetical protein